LDWKRDASICCSIATWYTELSQILDELQIVAAEYQIEVLRRLQKLMPTAQTLVEETRDKELGQILPAVATHVTSFRDS